MHYPTRPHSGADGIVFLILQKTKLRIQRDWVSFPSSRSQEPSFKSKQSDTWVCCSNLWVPLPKDLELFLDSGSPSSFGLCEFQFFLLFDPLVGRYPLVSLHFTHPDNKPLPLPPRWPDAVSVSCLLPNKSGKWLRRGQTRGHLTTTPSGGSSHFT